MIHNVIINYTKRILGINKKRLFPTKRKKDDVWLFSFPKSGNTWVRFILGNLMINFCKKNIEMNFNTMQNIVPDIYISNKIPLDLGFYPFPRIIKSHELYTKKAKRSIYLIRNPKDVLASYYHFMRDGHNIDFENFSEFLRDEKFGIEAWCKNIKSWINKADVIIKFEDLKTDPKNEVKKILNLLQIKISDSDIGKAIQNSTLNKMKNLEKIDQSWKEKHNLSKNYSFVRKGEVNQGKKYFDSEDLKYFNNVVLNNNLKKFLAEMKYD